LLKTDRVRGGHSTLKPRRAADASPRVATAEGWSQILLKKTRAAGEETVVRLEQGAMAHLRRIAPQLVSPTPIRPHSPAGSPSRCTPLSTHSHNPTLPHHTTF